MQMRNIIQSGSEYNIWNEVSLILIRSACSCGIYKGTERDPEETQIETVVLQVGEDRLCESRLTFFLVWTTMEWITIG